MTEPKDPRRDVDMGIPKPPNPAPPLPDPRWLTCCLALQEDGPGICRDTKGHAGPHQWERKKE